LSEGPYPGQKGHGCEKGKNLAASSRWKGGGLGERLPLSKTRKENQGLPLKEGANNPTKKGLHHKGGKAAE